MSNKKALLVGVNRYKNVGSLNGCVNDVRNIADILTSYYGFSTSEIRTIVDESVTRDNLMQRLDWLTDDAQPGDSLLFHFSGHGSQVLDRDGDELEDSMDEILCLHDMDFRDPNSYLLDDDLNHIIDRLPKEVYLTVCIDSCHSGTATRDIEVLKSELQIPHSDTKMQSRFIKPPADIDLRAYGMTFNKRSMGSKIREDKQVSGAVSSAKSKHILLAGCRDEQTSADAFIANDYNGAFTYYLCKAIRSKQGIITYEQLIENVRNSIAFNSYSQVPQLNGNEEVKEINFLSTLATRNDIALTCEHGHPMTCAEGHSPVGYIDEKSKKESEKEFLRERGKNKDKAALPISSKRINITIKGSHRAITPDIMLPAGSEFVGRVKDLTEVANKKTNGERLSIGEAYNPKCLDYLEDIEDFKLIHTLEFVPNVQRSLGQDESMQPLPLAVNCNEDEDVVLLSLEGGVWSWHVGNEEDDNTRDLSGKPLKTFSVPFKQQNRTTRGLWSKVVYCFKTAKNIATGHSDEVIHDIISKYESKKIKEGFKLIDAGKGFKDLTEADPISEWGDIKKKLNGHSDKKGLLFIHGTASSLDGGYGAIPVSILSEMQRRYPVILGYDHRSLSITPEINGNNMIKDLKDAAIFSEDIQFDVVTHSRGGLVLRSLVELCGGNSLVDNAIMVACPAAGTTLADPSRWESIVKLINHLSNISFFAGGAPLKIFFNLVGILLKFVSSKIKQPTAIPGLWAMNPGSEFLKRLNDTGKSIPGCTATYNTIGSNFEPSGIFKGGIKDDIIDSVADAFFGQANDLVVDTKSMDIKWPGGIAGGKDYEYVPDKHVYHLNYFNQIETMITFGKVFGLSNLDNVIEQCTSDKTLF
ncbi:caspase family protein [Desulfobacula sp.]|uniref:DUF7379 domain-containing protein n=1 Tax=Desulfobacula sp. TaxID=2593537 RepID=UPI001ED3E9DF|nr:caspase family protein [Desulfobacula sp.]